MKQIALYRLSVSLLTVALLMAALSLWDTQRQLAVEKEQRRTETAVLQAEKGHLILQEQQWQTQWKEDHQRLTDLTERLKAYEEPYWGVTSHGVGYGGNSAGEKVTDSLGF
jgi:hypothetical protein